MRNKQELRQYEDALWDERGNSEDPILTAKINAIGFIRGETDPITDEDFPIPKDNAGLDALIAALQKERTELPEHSLFGDPNWKMIDAQIDTCKWARG